MHKKSGEKKPMKWMDICVKLGLKFLLAGSCGWQFSPAVSCLSCLSCVTAVPVRVRASSSLINPSSLFYGRAIHSSRASHAAKGQLCLTGNMNIVPSLHLGSPDSSHLTQLLLITQPPHIHPPPHPYSIKFALGRLFIFSCTDISTNTDRNVWRK